MDAKDEARLRALEDRLAIYQVVCGYGYAVDGCNTEAVGNFYAEDGVYAVMDMDPLKGRTAVAGITTSPSHIGLVNGGVAHMSSLPYVVIDGDKAVATCHTMVPRLGEDGYYIWRLSASRIELSRQPDGAWRIDHRQNYLQNGDGNGPAMLARLKEGPKAA